MVRCVPLTSERSSNCRAPSQSYRKNKSRSRRRARRRVQRGVTGTTAALRQLSDTEPFLPPNSDTETTQDLDHLLSWCPAISFSRRPSQVAVFFNLSYLPEPTSCLQIVHTPFANASKSSLLILELLESPRRSHPATIDDGAKDVRCPAYLRNAMFDSQDNEPQVLVDRESDDLDVPRGIEDNRTLTGLLEFQHEPHQQDTCKIPNLHPPKPPTSNDRAAPPYPKDGGLYRCSRANVFCFGDRYSSVDANSSLHELPATPQQETHYPSSPILIAIDTIFHQTPATTDAGDHLRVPNGSETIPSLVPLTRHQDLLTITHDDPGSALLSEWDRYASQQTAFPQDEDGYDCDGAPVLVEDECEHKITEIDGWIVWASMGEDHTSQC